MAIDPISLCTTPVVLMNGEQRLSLGTGFFFLHSLEGARYVFLATNYHVLTGFAPSQTDDPAGDRVVFYLHKSREQPGQVQRVIYPLFTRDGTPMWLTNPRFPEADVALIPLATSVMEGCNLQCIAQNWIDTRILLRPASSVSMVGYPYGFHDTYNNLPIWKTGSLASEPDFDFGGKPLLLVDISTFRGMSGSPVFAIRQGAYEMAENQATIGVARKFLGIFSAFQTVRLKAYLQELAQASRMAVVTEENLQLGYVWKASVLSEVVAGFDAPTYQERILANAADLRAKAP